MPWRIWLALLFFFLVQPGVAQDPLEAFVAGYQALNVPEFQMSYLSNFQEMPTSQEQQREFFQRQRGELRRLDREALSDDRRCQLDMLLYEIDFNLERLRLEKRFLERRSAVENSPGSRVLVDPIENRSAVTRLPTDGLYRLPDGREWYRLYARRWASKDVSPEELLALGKSEMLRVQGEIDAIQRELGYGGRRAEFYRHLNGPEFFVTDRDELQAEFLALRETVGKNLDREFERVDVPPVHIRPVPDATKDTPPGYYDRGVFYYTFFKGRFPRRAKDWLFLHEAVPGHHYQSVVARQNELFWYPGFSEGWGAYAEDLGNTMGCYDDPYEYLGKWEWDLARSARVVLDVRIHYEGWTRDQALTWWRENVPNQDAIAAREVDRIVRWPGQVLSYKVGEQEFLRLRALAEKSLGLRQFHSLALQMGSIPLPVLEDMVLRQLARTGSPR